MVSAEKPNAYGNRTIYDNLIFAYNVRWFFRVACHTAVTAYNILLCFSFITPCNRIVRYTKSLQLHWTKKIGDTIDFVLSYVLRNGIRQPIKRCSPTATTIRLNNCMFEPHSDVSNSRLSFIFLSFRKRKQQSDRGLEYICVLMYGNEKQDTATVQ